MSAACAQPTRSNAPLPSPAAGFAAVPLRFSFTTIAVPGATRTVASGINDRGEIVGVYDDSSGTHGFSLSNGEFATIDFPGANFTMALGIGAGGAVVGAYRGAGEAGVQYHGFLRTSAGRFERVDAPPYKHTIAQRILPDGTILGCRHDDDFGASMRGAVLTPLKYGETPAFGSMHNGATPDLRRIVGLYNFAPADRSAAYVIDHGKFSPLVVPGSTATSAWDVNAAGVTVGTYRDSAAVHGFVLTDAGFVPLNVPGATMTRALGINSGGAVVGSFEAGGRTAGFLATAALTPSRPEVALNHVNVVLDSATLAAIEASAFLTNEFSHYRKSTNRTADGRSWTGVNLFGERTYVELFPRGTQGGVGFSGLALSVEQPGAIDSVAAWLDAKFEVPIRRRLVEGLREGRSFPWFHSVSVEHDRGDSLWQVHSWVMENHPEFYRVVQQDTTGPAEDISRKRYLKRRYDPQRMVRDVVGVSLALLPTIGEQLRGELEALDWRIEGGGERGRYRAVGSEADIVVTPIAPGDPYGISEIRFALSRGPATVQVYELGNSRLEVCSAHARWTFGDSPVSSAVRGRSLDLCR